ncbi:MAG: hypothetical protein KC417_01480, partial [Myxococcales bacterium]|nr:hypothetical protein [Myxococcales bacterium]
MNPSITTYSRKPLVLCGTFLVVVLGVASGCDGASELGVGFERGHSDSSVPDDSDGKGDSPHAGDSGILNGDGGVPAGPSCFDGIQNQDETSFDCGGVCGDCEPGTFSLSLADFMQSKFDITVNGERYTNENSLSPVYTENYLYCDWSAPDASTCRAQTLAACPNLQPNQWGCLLKGRANVEGAGWKYGFYTRPERPNFRYLSKGGFPPSTLEVFWFDSAWVYAFSSTLGLPNKFMSYQQPPHASVTYPYRGGVWYRNAFTVNKASGLPGVWVGPTILAPDNDVLEFNDNRWTKTTVWGPGTPGSEGYLVSRYYPRMVNFSNEDGGMLPKAMNVLAIESGRRDVGHPEIVRFQETYFYAAYGPQRFGLIRFELWASEPAVCLDNAGRYPDAICNGHMVRSGVTSPNRFTHLPEYDQAPYANTKAFFTDAFAQKPKNDPKPKRRDPWTSN